MSERESVRVLRECIDLQNKKGQDYQSKDSSVRQADYYPSGVLTIYEIMHAKMLRMKSLMEKRANDASEATFESLEDSAKDLINYTSFFAAWLRNGVDGQATDRDMFNKPMLSKSPIIARAAEYISDPQKLGVIATTTTLPSGENAKIKITARPDSTFAVDHLEDDATGPLGFIK